MTTVVERKTAAAKFSICALGAVLAMSGVVQFLVASSGKSEGATNGALSWTWAIMAMGFSVALSSRLIGRKSRLARVLLVVGITVLLASIVFVRFVLVIAA